jgi:glycosyltransferase involved in cell wall biosynthesis
MLSQFFAPIVGGEERAVEDLAAELAARGHEVAVATLRSEGTPQTEEIAGIRVHRVDGLGAQLGWLFAESARRHLPPAPDPQVVAGLRRVLSEEKPQVVHAHNWIVHSFLPLKRRLGAPLVLSLHDYSLICANKRLWRFEAVCEGPGPAKCLRCATAQYGIAKGPVVAGSLLAMAPALRRSVDMYLPVSGAVADALGLARRGLPFEVIPNLIPERSHNGLPGADPALLDRLPAGDFLLFLGDASVDKGARVLLDAYTMLEDAPPLVFIGRPLAAAHERSGTNVHVLGIWPHATALEAVRRCSMLVVPSLVRETFGMVALEAMAMGRPVVAARSGGLGELVVDGETGVLVPPGDAPALRDAIAGLLAEPARREALGRAGTERAASYSAPHVVPRVERVYRLLAGAGAEAVGAVHVES